MNRLLIIDDDLAVARVIGRAANGIGFEIQITNDPQAFLALVASWKPSVSVIDLCMPTIDGVQLLGRLADMLSETSIVIASGMDHRTIQTVVRLGQAHGLKVAGALTKPFHVDDVERVLQPLLHARVPAAASDVA